MKKFDNFVRAYNNLLSVNDYHEPYSLVEITGLVGLFEICFEQSWKAIKEIMENNGYGEFKSGSPKHIIKCAFSAGLISDEEIWIDALVDRNNVAHSYNEDIALSIIRNTKDEYIPMFKALIDEINKNWR